jgi:glycosyltransferase involved in cell wall biosynthesis
MPGRRSVLFVARTRYRLPLDAATARKWDALAERLGVRVVATAADGSAVDDGRFRLLGTASGVAYYPAVALAVARELRSFRPDAILAQSPYEGAAALLGRRLAGRPVPVVVEVHGDWRTAARLYGSPLRRVLELPSRLAARYALRRADAVRPVGPFTAGLVRELGVEPAASFTTYFDLSAFTARPPLPLPERPAALFVGVLERYKNVAGLASAWRRVAAAEPEARLRLIGRGRERATVERLVADLPGQTTWSEQVAPAEVAAALDDATALVLPSWSEGLPRVAMEAFARGRPVVGSRAGGIPDIVEDGVSGLLVPPGDAAALADALLRVLRDRALAERLAAGAAGAASRWAQTPEEYADRVAALVEEACR